MTRILTILALLLLLVGGCADTWVVIYGMTTSDPTVRDCYSWNIRGPEAKEVREHGTANP